MSKLKSHIDNISKTVDDWLHPDNTELKEAIDRTVDEGFFSFEDVKHQMLVLKNSLTKENLEKWAAKSDLMPGSLKDKRVLCLHAGNIPLVGIQDLLSVVMTGGEYAGKISKKDPYLLSTFLNKLTENHIVEGQSWSLDLNDFENKRSDGVLFAGSEASAENVESKLKSLEIITENTPKLMRTAHFSIAIITDNDPQTMEDLTEAVFRYGGTGCRSVAIVIAPFYLDSEKCSFTDYVESFWLKNPQHEKPSESLFYRYAYNKALGIPQAWLNDFLIEEKHGRPHEKFLLQWVTGDFRTLEKLVENSHDGLQSVYSTANHIGREVYGYPIEPLSLAQSPPIWWKPDQVDTIQWLQKKVAHH